MDRIELFIVVAVFLLVVVFIGCSGKYESVQETEMLSKMTQEEKETPELEAEVTVTMDHEEVKKDTLRRFKVHFIDVGQGDAALIQTPNKANFLIDCGDRNHAPVLAKYLKKQGVNKINALVVTHPDSEHYGGCEEALDNFVVEAVYDNGRTEDGELFQEFQEFARKTHYQHVSLDYVLKIDPAVRTEFITAYGMGGYEMENKDDNSLMFRVIYGNADFLFMGDCEEECEEEIIPREELGGVDVLKVGHHGAKTSTNGFFLKEVTPQIAVISVGQNNRYGFPDEEVLERLSGMEIYRTDRNGNIVISTDGGNFRTTMQRS